MIWSALAPYSRALKLGLLALVFVAGVRTGCSWQGGRDAEAIARKDRALQASAEQLHAAAGALRQVNAHTAAEVARAAASAAANAHEAATANARADAYRDLLVQIEDDVEEAKRQSPACRAKLEERPCAALR